jgi:hypothetical protein
MMKTCGLSFLIPAYGATRPGGNERSGYADQHGDDDSAWVLARHNEFRHGPND